MVPVGEAVGLQWEQIGIDVSYENIEFTTLVGLAYERNLSGSAYVFETYYDDSPTNAISATTHSDSFLGWGADDPHLDQLMDATLAEIDDAKRTELERQVGQYMIDNLTLIPIAYTQQVAGLSDKIEEWDFWPMYFDYAGEVEFMTLED
jgi:ABC-type transport system substrate-binding protein